MAVGKCSDDTDIDQRRVDHPLRRAGGVPAAGRRGRAGGAGRVHEGRRGPHPREPGHRRRGVHRRSAATCPTSTCASTPTTRRDGPRGARPGAGRATPGAAGHAAHAAGAGAGAARRRPAVGQARRPHRPGHGWEQGPEAGAPVWRGAGGRRGHADHGRRRPVQPLPHDRGGRRSPRLARPPGAGRRCPGRAGRQPAPVEPLRRRAALRRGDGLGCARGREGRPGRGAAGPREAALRHPDRRQHAGGRGRVRGRVRRAPAAVRGGRTAAAIGRARQLERWDARRAAGRSGRGGGGRRTGAGDRGLRGRQGHPRRPGATRRSWPTPRSTTSD